MINDPTRKPADDHAEDNLADAAHGAESLEDLEALLDDPETVADDMDDLTGEDEDLGGSGRSPEDVIAALIADNEALKKARDDAKDQMLRVAAEMENLRRRTERDVKDSRAYAITNFARDLLTIGDNLDRTLSAVPDEAALNEGAEAVKAALTGLLEGVDMTGRELVRVLAKHNVTKEEPDGEKFDPNRHQAMFEIPNPDVPSGTVMQVVQAGYMLGERVLRPAMVGVAKGGPKAAKSAAKDEG